MASLIATPPSAIDHSPDTGRWILYQAVFGDDVDLGLVRPDGTDAHRIPGGPGNRWHPDWSPDGMRIAYDHEPPTADVDELWLLNVDGSDEYRLLECVDPCLGHQGAAWSPDGQTIGFDAAEGPSDDHPDGVCYTAALDLEAETVTRILEFPGCDGGGEDRRLKEAIFMRFSPDGRRIVAQGVGPGTDTAIFTASREGAELTQLTDWGLGARPDWSPDGEWIAFMSIVPETAPGSPVSLHRVRPDGSELEQLTDPGGATTDLYPRFLPDSSAILFSRCVSPFSCETRMIDADGSNDRRVFGETGRQTVHVMLQPGLP